MKMKIGKILEQQRIKNFKKEKEKLKKHLKNRKLAKVWTDLEIESYLFGWNDAISEIKSQIKR